MAYEFFNHWTPIFMESLMADFDLSVEDAAAICGNAGHESGGFKSLQEKNPIVKGSRGGYGIMQWTGPRRRDYEAYCARNNFNPADMDVNYKFLFVELNGPEGKVIPKIKKADGLYAKVEVFSNTFLRPGIPHMASRKKWADRAMAAWEASGRKVPEAPEWVDDPWPKPDVEPIDPEPQPASGGFFAAIVKLIAAIFGDRK